MQVHLTAASELQDKQTQSARERLLVRTAEIKAYLK